MNARIVIALVAFIIFSSRASAEAPPLPAFCAPGTTMTSDQIRRLLPGPRVLTYGPWNDTVIKFRLTYDEADGTLGKIPASQNHGFISLNVTEITDIARTYCSNIASAKAKESAEARRQAQAEEEQRRRAQEKQAAALSRSGERSADMVAGMTPPPTEGRPAEAPKTIPADVALCQNACELFYGDTCNIGGQRLFNENCRTAKQTINNLSCWCKK